MRDCFPEYDLHPRGAHVDDAISMFRRIVIEARSFGPSVFGVITGHGSSGGTARIRSAILDECKLMAAGGNIRGYLPGECAGDIFTSEYLSFPETQAVPVRYKRSPNPGIIFIAV